MIRPRRGIGRAVQRAALARTIRYPICLRQGISTSHLRQASRRESEKAQSSDDSPDYEEDSHKQRDTTHHDGFLEALRRSKGSHEIKEGKSASQMGSLAQAMSGWTTLKERLGGGGEQVSPDKEFDNYFKQREDLDDDIVDYLKERRNQESDDTPEKPSKKRKASSSGTHAPKKDTQKSPKSKGKKGKGAFNVKSIRPKKLSLTPIDEGENIEVPQLAYGLDKVLFNSGVYQIQDQRSKVYNFDPYLTSIMPIEQFDFDALKAYITSSKDTKLRSISAKHGKKYCGSTSSMTAILSQFHFLISQWREPNFSHLSKTLKIESHNFTALSRSPAAAYARLEDGVYAIDADKEYDRENVLSMLGKSMEKLLTLPKEEFEKYRINRSHLLTEEERNADEAYHYTTLGDFMMRSQLDAHDPRLPGTGVFDLKTRAVLTIRMDVQDYEKRRGYELTQRFGQFASFEREYHDMIRAAFLKYSLQVRMGRMDGIFVAFHNTQRIFGFQYIPLEEMDNSIHNTENRDLGDYEFKVSLQMLNDLLDRATKKFPGRSLRLVVETRQAKVPFLYFFAEPVSDEEMKESDEASTESAIKLAEEIIDQSQREREALELSQKAQEREQAQEQEQELEREPESTVEESERPIDAQDVKADDVWQALMAKVEETIENESLGKDFIRESLHEALEKVDVLSDRTSKEYGQHIDALVESLTDASPGSREIEEASETNPVGQISDSESRPSSPNDPTVEATSEHDASSTETLRDLIIKVTRGIEDKKVEELGKFERMFAELAAKTKQAAAKSDDNTADLEESPAQPRVDTDPGSTDEPDGTKSHRPLQRGSSSPGKLDFNYTPPEDLLGMVVTVRNQVNGRWVDRAEMGNLRKFDWVVEYGIKELGDSEARRVYAQSRRRRYTHFDNIKKNENSSYQQQFQSLMLELSRRGAKFREAFENEQKGKDLLVAWDKKPLYKAED